MARYQNILETIGNTPLVRLQKLAPRGINLYAKLEAFNPGGSVKDRMARAVIDRAEQSGELQPGQTVIEATSGNTGIGLAMVCARKGYPLVVVMAENFSVERRKLLRFLGARVVLTPASEKGTGMLAKAVELADRHGWFLCRQFENEANADVHSATTAREIIDDFRGEKLHYWVSGFGTGGTLKGVARAFRQGMPDTRIVVAEPDNAQVLGSGIPQPRDANGNISTSHPRFRPHLMQGWSPDFISTLTEDALAGGMIDEVVPVAGNEALQLSRDLALQEGIFAGISSGATLAAALSVAHRSPAGTNIVCMLPDTGERYLSTPLFEHIGEAMNGEELAISASTPLCRFDITREPDSSRGDPEREPEVKRALDTGNADPPGTDVIDATVSEIISAEPVVMFALEWCEFSWSVRKLFRALQVPYQSIDLDSVAYQAGDRGLQLRAALTKHTGVPTIPQIFIGGEYVGGCTELFKTVEEGTFYQRLVRHGVKFRADASINPSALLPGWVQPRKSA